MSKTESQTIKLYIGDYCKEGLCSAPTLCCVTDKNNLIEKLNILIVQVRIGLDLYLQQEKTVYAYYRDLMHKTDREIEDLFK